MNGKGLGFSYGPDDWFRSRMGWGLSPFTAGAEAEYRLPHYAAVDISRREKRRNVLAGSVMF